MKFFYCTLYSACFKYVQCSTNNSELILFYFFNVFFSWREYTSDRLCFPTVTCQQLACRWRKIITLYIARNVTLWIVQCNKFTYFIFRHANKWKTWVNTSSSASTWSQCKFVRPHIQVETLFICHTNDLNKLLGL